MIPGVKGSHPRLDERQRVKLGLADLFREPVLYSLRLRALRESKYPFWYRRPDAKETLTDASLGTSADIRKSLVHCRRSGSDNPQADLFSAERRVPVRSAAAS